VQTFAILILGLFVAQGVGYGVHRLLHAPWSGPLFRAHMAHHQDLYGPGASFLSDQYLYPAARQRNELLFLPFLAAIAFALFALLPPALAAACFAEILLWAWLSSRLHDALHVRGVWLERFAWFGALRARHRQHHCVMRTNLGIVEPMWDRLFGTFAEPTAEMRSAPSRERG
jgi:sterol desaturase/sphingolipid hydroxylase (fatty acid hydroxylase superfamily)